MRSHFTSLAILALGGLIACEPPKTPPVRVDVRYDAGGYNAAGTAYPITETQKRCALYQLTMNDVQLSTFARMRARDDFGGLDCVEREIDQ